MLEVDEFLASRKKEIVDFVEQKDPKGLKTTGSIFDRLVNELASTMPFGPTFDKTHNCASQRFNQFTVVWLAITSNGQ